MLANPPYVRQEKIIHFKDRLKENTTYLIQHLTFMFIFMNFHLTYLKKKELRFLYIK